MKRRTLLKAAAAALVPAPAAAICIPAEPTPHERLRRAMSDACEALAALFPGSHVDRRVVLGDGVGMVVIGAHPDPAMTVGGHFSFPIDQDRWHHQ